MTLCTVSRWHTSIFQQPSVQNFLQVSCRHFRIFYHKGFEKFAIVWLQLGVKGNLSLQVFGVTYITKCLVTVVQGIATNSILSQVSHTSHTHTHTHTCTYPTKTFRVYFVDRNQRQLLQVTGSRLVLRVHHAERKPYGVVVWRRLTFDFQTYPFCSCPVVA